MLKSYNNYSQCDRIPAETVELLQSQSQLPSLRSEGKCQKDPSGTTGDQTCQRQQTALRRQKDDSSEKKKSWNEI